MKPGFVPEMRPLGLQLEVAARALSSAKRQLPAWLVPLAKVMERVAQAPLAHFDRFVRVEATDLRRLDGPAPVAAPINEVPALPDGVRERLRSRVGPAADRMRVHDDEIAHWLAHDHAADAVSVGSDVYFARGRYQPHDSRGFALLAHEAVHVDYATRPDAPWQRTGASALAAEEALAHAVERAAWHGTPVEMHSRFVLPPAAGFALPTAAPAGATPVATSAGFGLPTAAPAGATPVATSAGFGLPTAALAGATPVATSAAQRPMAAAADRVVDATPSASTMDMEAMRQTLMRDLMRQIRTDMERGG